MNRGQTMENPCKIIFFGDSITQTYTPEFEKMFKKQYPEIKSEIINAGVSGETSRDGLKRLSELIDEKPDVVLIGFGMNDWRKDISKEQYKKNISEMVDKFEEIGARVLLVTINPDYQGKRAGTSEIIDKYNDVIKAIALEKRTRIADVNSMWKREIKPIQAGLSDEIHPNSKGYDIYCKAFLRVVPKRNTTVLWEYNGNPCACNYRCPYCHDFPKTEHHFRGSIKQWHEGFKKSFRNQHITFYISFGEPMIGKNFYEVIDMIGSEPNWEMMMTSNLSQQLDRLMKSRLARDNRLHINGSFHSTETTIDEFLEKLLFLREHGIESPVIYVMYPPLMKEFKGYFEIFSKHNFLLHVRRYEGGYKGKSYPNAYTGEELQFIARYEDDATIKYMLNNKLNFGELTYSGMYYIIVDNVGNIGWNSDYFPKYSIDRCRFGNILQNNIKVLLEPIPYPGHTCYGTIDGVANALDLNYRELEGNHLLSYMRQGGVCHTNTGEVFYKNMNTDFNDCKIRAEYNFPPRNIKEKYYKIKYMDKRHYLKRRAINFSHKVYHRLLNSKYGWMLTY
jgi:lysophospholipase L1-like esterase